MFRQVICLLSLILILLATGNAEADLVGHWRLDGSAADSSGNGHDGEIFGEPKWVDGKIGGAMELDGDDWLEMPGTSAAEGFAGLEDEVTWAAWFKTSNTGVLNTLMAQGPAGAAHIQGNRSINIEASGVIMIRAHSVGALTSLNSIAVVNDGEWHHVVVTTAFETDGDNDTMKVYIDGDLSIGYETDTVNINQHSGPAADFIVTLGARGSTPFIGLIDDVRIYDHVLSDVEILSIMAGKPWPYAFGPKPADGALHEDTWVNLSWLPGELAVSHDIYLGVNFDDVDNGAEGTFVGNQTGTFIVIGFPGFPFPDGLVPGTTYYWRIDEVNETEPNSPWKGDVWSFSIPPKTAYFPNPADGSESVALDVELSWTGGFGSKLHTVYFGDNFDDVSNAAGGLPQGSATFTPGPLELAKTYYWRVDEFDAADTFKGDVWSFITEGAVGSPDPAKGAVDVTQKPVLTWVPGVFADTHEVFFDTDAAALESKGTGNLGSESYDTGNLEWDTTYYWRIDEANNANADSPWTGPLWSFTTANFLIIDDFENYNDLDPADPASNRIFNVWLDGFDNPAVNGSIVGHANPPFAEQTIVHGGLQSMPMAYDNVVGKSEATLTLTANRDWTVNGVNTLTIWYRGGSANAAETMYVVLNGTAGVDNDNPNAAQAVSWTEWNIDLQAFADQGINLTNVTSITLGLGNRTNPVTGGAGMMYFDDIRLYRPTQ
ncbi:MAG: LamG domain-containing protein [Planctomycetes bacterium]|nr:LamG domain-containing protein [Planctomycetota bacterium]